MNKMVYFHTGVYLFFFFDQNHKLGTGETSALSVTGRINTYLCLFRIEHCPCCESCCKESDQRGELK